MTAGRTSVPSFRRTVGLRRLTVLVLAGLAVAGAAPASGVTEPDPAEPTVETAATVQAAATTGSISGTVTSGGRAVSGVTVSAYDAASRLSATGTTNAVGAYVLNGLVPGEHKVSFSAYGTGLVSEHYDDALAWSDADPVTVTAGATTQRIDAVLAVGGRIRGTVTGPTGPVADVWVSAWTATVSGGAYTAADGTYEIMGLPAGTYMVRFYGDASGLVNEYYDDAIASSGADGVTVTAGATVQGINATLVDGGSIAGVVHGPSGPVPDVYVWASGSSGGYGYAITGADGTYRIPGLPADTYRVGFDPTTESGLRDEYYDNALSWYSAARLTTAASQDVSGVNAVLARESDPLFPDVPDGAPFHAEIEWLAYHGVTTGYSDGTFRPSAPVDRQAMAAFLYRTAGEPPFTPPATPTFRDVPTTSPFYTAVEWLADTGITTGWPDGTFRPAATVERQAMAAFLFRYAGEPSFPEPAAARFTDVPMGSPFFTEVEWLASTRITTGWPDGTFRPTAMVQRQAMAAFLMRFDEWRS